MAKEKTRKTKETKEVKGLKEEKTKEPSEAEAADDLDVKPVVEPSEVVEVISKEEIEKKEEEKQLPTKSFNKDKWTPKTSLGKKVKDGKIDDIDYILDNGLKILESEIVDALMPDMETDLLLIGQSKGKFGGGQRRVFRQTQKKTKEGNKPHFATYAVIGNKNGYFGIGYGKAKETVPAREKAIRQAKLNVRKISRGCGSWECNCGNPHTIPFQVEGKCGSSIVKLFPAPKGTGLCIEKESAKILKLAGIKDVWSKSAGQTGTKLNHLKACVQALDNLLRTRLSFTQKKDMNVVEGKLQSSISSDVTDSTNVEEE
ncbi:30S ribosomal protein S5 [Candidatus Woesearchaeota archaeon]|nr:30S ribosomal protein S5 [Candidatus Woesearchaeota archaeon]